MPFKIFLQVNALIAWMICSATAQTEKERIIAGGSFGLSAAFGKQKYTMDGDEIGKVTYNQFDISPYAGYFVMKDFMVAFYVIS